jgi:hypothetical protein
MYHQVIRGIELLILKNVDESRDRAIVFGSRDSASIVLARDKSALLVATVPITVVGGTPKDANLARLLDPPEYSVIWDVAEKKITPIREPDWAFRPTGAGVQAFDGGIVDFVFCEARINHFHRRIGIDHRSFALLFSR